MKFIRALFYFEGVVLNTGVGLLCMIVPAAFVATFIPTGIPALALEFIRWYGVLLIGAGLL